MAEVANKLIRGSFGRIWVNGRLMANVKSFEAKASLHYETVQINGELCDQQRYTGYDLSGTMVLHKIDSFVANLLTEGIASGQLPTIKLVGALTDPDSKGAERVEIYDVTFDEFTLLQFENASIGEESIPYKAGGYRLIDTID